MRQEKGFPAGVADHTVFLRIEFHRANRGIPNQACITRKLHADRSRNRNARSGIRTRAKSDDDRFRRAKFFSHSLEILEKRRRVFSIVRPFASKLNFAISPGTADALRGKFKRESLHDEKGIAL